MYILCMYVCMHACMYVCMYVYIYIHMFPSLHPNLDVCYTYIATELRLTYGPGSQQGHDG